MAFPWGPPPLGAPFWGGKYLFFFLGGAPPPGFPLFWGPPLFVFFFGPPPPPQPPFGPPFSNFFPPFSGLAFSSTPPRFSPRRFFPLFWAPPLLGAPFFFPLLFKRGFPHPPQVLHPPFSFSEFGAPLAGAWAPPPFSFPIRIHLFPFPGPGVFFPPFFLAFFSFPFFSPPPLGPLFPFDGLFPFVKRASNPPAPVFPFFKKKGGVFPPYESFSRAPPNFAGFVGFLGKFPRPNSPAFKRTPGPPFWGPKKPPLSSSPPVIFFPL
ncbi:unnamed protein product [Acanthosepion pharaonis]|uniref:Uncharacterized protein n=1 Tax=Acanthosepion pharaonis TaxID=158019 RepID=A0A812CGX1_ACAPH|nr:unnamed protein product [Sepia pharaonis]